MAEVVPNIFRGKNVLLQEMLSNISQTCTLNLRIYFLFSCRFIAVYLKITTFSIATFYHAHVPLLNISILLMSEKLCYSKFNLIVSLLS